jgi:glycosyltransferase involved in cell wall biosynthesis
VPAKLLFVFPLAVNFTLHWVDRVKAIAAAGADVHVAVPDSTDLDDLELESITLHRLNAPRDSRRFLYDISMLREIPRVIRKVKPDILHAATTRPVLYGGVFGRLFGVPSVVLSVTGLGYLFIGKTMGVRVLRFLSTFVYRFALLQKKAITIFENPDDRDDFVNRRFVREEQTAVLIGGGIDLSKYVHALEPETKSPLVIVAGRLLKDKGIVEFVEAAKTLKLRGVQARFALVGDVDPGNPATLDVSTIEKWVEDGHVEWWGWQDDMIDVYRRSNLVCLPSYREGAPRTILEAAATGRACVATDVPGCRDVVVDGVTGRLVPAQTVAPLADALQLLVEDANLRREMGTSARRYAEQEFSNEKRIVDLKRVYEKLLGTALSEENAPIAEDEKIQTVS